MKPTLKTLCKEYTHSKIDNFYEIDKHIKKHPKLFYHHSNKKLMNTLKYFTLVSKHMLESMNLLKRHITLYNHLKLKKFLLENE